MSGMEPDAVNVEPITRGKIVGMTPLKRFARAGLDLQIGDFRELCQELARIGIPLERNDIADILFLWMTSMLEQKE